MKSLNRAAFKEAQSSPPLNYRKKGSTIDRAWENVLNALRSFALPQEGADA